MLLLSFNENIQHLLMVLVSPMRMSSTRTRFLKWLYGNILRHIYNPCSSPLIYGCALACWRGYAMARSMDVGLPPVSSASLGKRSSLQVPATLQRLARLNMFRARGTVMGRACHRGDQPDQGICNLRVVRCWMRSLRSWLGREESQILGPCCFQDGSV